MISNGDFNKKFICLNCTIIFILIASVFNKFPLCYEFVVLYFSLLGNRLEYLHYTNLGSAALLKAILLRRTPPLILKLRFSLVVVFPVNQPGSTIVINTLNNLSSFRIVSILKTVVSNVSLIVEQNLQLVGGILYANFVKRIFSEVQNKSLHPDKRLEKFSYSR